MSAATLPASLPAPGTPGQESSSTERAESVHSTSGTKRSFFGFGRKKEKRDKSPPSPPLASPTRIVSDKPPLLPLLPSMPSINASPPPSTDTTPAPKSPVVTTPTKPTVTPQSPTISPQRSLASASPPPLARPATAATASPPRLSTSSSMIFERNVQEQTSTSSSAIPAHMQTEDMIPPVLEAASTAITDRDCGVDEVEIVTHSIHQPAVSVVAPALSNSASPIFENPAPNRLSRQGSPPSAPSIAESLTSATTSCEDISSTTADKRRLSFISFADVVQAEQADPSPATPANRSPSRGSPVQSAVDSVSIATISEQLRRSPSPIRGGGLGAAVAAGSPPKSSLPGSFSSRNGDMSSSHSSGDRGELMVETMRQALRKTGSGEFAPPLHANSNRSPISDRAGPFGHPLTSQKEGK